MSGGGGIDVIGCRHGNRTEQLTATSSSSRSGAPSGGEEGSEGGGGLASGER